MTDQEWARLCVRGSFIGLGALIVATIVFGAVAWVMG